MERQLKIQNEQIKNNFFAEYTKRYQEIILHFPENINDVNFSYEDLSVPRRERIMRYMRVYFDLCSEEYFLHKKKHLDEIVWEEWKTGMTYAFNKPAFQKAWKVVTKNSEFYTEFRDFVESEIVKRKEKGDGSILK
ncbi:MAG: hypothetical protein KJ957_07960 [Candidatus Omnitrophica bacterium]|nr:hypothetical protein [Candidatus Omnitrophota bacterium]